MESHRGRAVGASRKRAGWLTNTSVILLAATGLAACEKEEASDATQGDVGADTAAVATPAAAAEPITDIVAIVAVPDRVPLVGRRVTVTGVKVQTVTGPSTFWVGPGPDRQLFVVRTAATGTDTAAGSAADTSRAVRVGQTVLVSGVIRQLPTDLGQVRAAWSLSTANEATLTRERVYLEADRVEGAGA